MMRAICNFKKEVQKKKKKTCLFKRSIRTEFKFQIKYIAKERQHIFKRENIISTGKEMDFLIKSVFSERKQWIFFREKHLFYERK